MFTQSTGRITKGVTNEQKFTEREIMRHLVNMSITPKPSKVD